MLIAIDAGHGHNTAGKRCPDDSMRENDFNRATADKVCSILNNNGIETYRSDDITGNTDVPLKTRTNNINSKNAKICVSIHANANTGNWNSANGIETYIIATGGEAEKLANIVQRKLIEKTGRRNRGVKVGNLHMCRETKMPAILCECGFMDNREEAALLKTDNYRQKCAEAITEGILEYFGVEPKKTTNQLLCKAHIQDIGWTDYCDCKNGIGTEHQAKRLEAIQFSASDDIDIQYRVHVQDIGWQEWKNKGEIAGTTGQSKRIEAIEIKCNKVLEVKEHVEDVGWLPASKGTEIHIGTVGKALRLEAFKINIM